MQFQGKLMNQTWENGKKPSFRPNLVHLTQIWAANFFFINLAPSVTRCYGQLSSCIISEKTNDPILRKLSDGWMDRWRDRWTDGQKDGLTDRWTRVIPQDAVRLTLSIQNEMIILLWWLLPPKIFNKPFMKLKNQDISTSIYCWKLNYI